MLQDRPFSTNLRIRDAAHHQVNTLDGPHQRFNTIKVYQTEVASGLDAAAAAQHPVSCCLQCACREIAEDALSAKNENGFCGHGLFFCLDCYTPGATSVKEISKRVVKAPSATWIASASAACAIPASGSILTLANAP